MVIPQEEFRRISVFENFRRAWVILETTYEGTKVVKNSFKFQTFTSKFEEIRMSENETIEKFYPKLNDMENSTFNLMNRSCAQIFRKVKRSLYLRLVRASPWLLKL